MSEEQARTLRTLSPKHLCPRDQETRMQRMKQTRTLPWASHSPRLCITSETFEETDLLAELSACGPERPWHP